MKFIINGVLILLGLFLAAELIGVLYRTAKYYFNYFEIDRNLFIWKNQNSRLTRQICDSYPYYARDLMLCIAMEFAAASRMEGDYLEFGVNNGQTFKSAYRFARRNFLKSMKFYAFDSFEGLPEIKGIDLEVSQFSKGEYACGIEKFRKIISRAGMDMDRVQLVPGWYSDVLNEKLKNKLALKKAAVIYVDCDLYESTVPVLDFITSYIQDGTLLIFDDWFCFRGSPERGEQKAFRAWLAKNPSIKATEFHKFGWHGNSFIISKHS